MENGYDQHPFGLKNDSTPRQIFLDIHVTSVSCASVSFICACLVIILSFYLNDFWTFFRWKKNERFAVYLALWDGLFNISAGLSHLTYLVVKDHVRPPWLCRLYAYGIVQFSGTQCLMVNVIAVNTFAMMAFNNDLDYGRCDYRLLSYTVGVPLLCGIIFMGLGHLGPALAICAFDGVRGSTSKLVYNLTTQTMIVLLNALLYIATWIKIRIDTSAISGHLGQMSVAKMATQRAAKLMTLFVAAFFIQWLPISILTIYNASHIGIPYSVGMSASVLTNFGGVFNGVVFLIIQISKRRNAGEKDSSHIKKTSSEGKRLQQFPDDHHAFSISEMPTTY